MITIVYGAPGAGKDAYLTKTIHDIYFNSGYEIFDDCVNQINLLNENRRYKLTLPDRVPIYTDFDVNVQIGYNEFYKPYFANGFYIGLENENVEVLYLAPGSKLFLTEVQRYYDSRKSNTFPDWVSRYFEMHRHYGIDIYLNLQRLSLLDLNIRQLAGRFVLIENLEHKFDDVGRIVSSQWHCKEFDNYADVDLFCESHKKTFDSTSYSYTGDIFESFNSYGNFNSFIPKDKRGKDFIYLEHNVELTKNDYRQKYYNFTMPVDFRKKVA